MKPLYFPFTTIPEPVIGALLACFKQVAVFQPSRNHIPELYRNLENRGRLQIHLPDVDENDPLPHLLKAYHAWAELHEGERPDFEKFRPPLPPFTDSSAPSRIRSDIRKAAEGTETTLSPADRERSMLLRARLFLTVAQEHDQLQQALREDISKIGGMEKDLFRNLHMDQGEPFPESPLNLTAETSENDYYMSDTRMIAWVRLYEDYRKSADAETVSIPETPHLLVTSNRPAMDLLLEAADSADRICSVSGIPFSLTADLSENVFFNEQRCERLRKLSVESDRSAVWDDSFSDTGNESSRNGRLTIYRIKGDPIAKLLSRRGIRSESSRKGQRAGEKQYTLVGSIIKEDLCEKTNEPNIF